MAVKACQLEQDAAGHAVHTVKKQVLVSIPQLVSSFAFIQASASHIQSVSFLLS